MSCQIKPCLFFSLPFVLLACICAHLYVCGNVYFCVYVPIDIETISSPTVSPYHSGPCNMTPKHSSSKGGKKEPRLNLSTKLISIQGSPASSKIVREDSHCGLLENSCDDLSDDDDVTEDDSQQMEYYFDGETIIQRKCNSIPRRRNKECRVSLKQFSFDASKDQDMDSPSLRNSGEFGSVGCLPCTPTPTRKPGKKMNKVDSVPSPNPPQQANRHDSAALSGNNWCCGVVASPRKAKGKDQMQ